MNLWTASQRCSLAEESAEVHDTYTHSERICCMRVPSGECPHPHDCDTHAVGPAAGHVNGGGQRVSGMNSSKKFVFSVVSCSIAWQSSSVLSGDASSEPNSARVSYLLTCKEKRSHTIRPSLRRNLYPRCCARRVKIFLHTEQPLGHLGNQVEPPIKEIWPNYLVHSDEAIHILV